MHVERRYILVQLHLVLQTYLLILQIHPRLLLLEPMSDILFELFL